jgi:hypothetical protein
MAANGPRLQPPACGLNPWLLSLSLSQLLGVGITETGALLLDSLPGHHTGGTGVPQASKRREMGGISWAKYSPTGHHI